ncbi:VanZ family protein [Flavobacterium sp.]|uniref:VanZ family protein n=1 Tax=Flavobacterium sp. TaxID=239 RepID=UPI00286C4383|nr:VanZ family protein [Flavobacterium sp.]
MGKQIYFLTALFWTGIITFFCLVQFSAVPFRGVSNLDKLVHVFFHFVFTILWFLYFQKQLMGRDKTRLLLFSFLFSVFFGISIELLQKYFTTTRNGDFLDVLANSIGAITAVLVIIIIRKYTNLFKI